MEFVVNLDQELWEKKDKTQRVQQTVNTATPPNKLQTQTTKNSTAIAAKTGITFVYLQSEK